MFYNPIGGRQRPAIQIVAPRGRLDDAVAEQVRLRFGGVGVRNQEGAGGFGNRARDVQGALNVQGAGSAILGNVQEAGVIEILGARRGCKDERPPCGSYHGGLVQKGRNDGGADIGKRPATGESGP